MSDDRRAQGTRRNGRTGEPEQRDGRVPPHNLDAEESLLGAAMLSATALEVLVKKTRPEDFYRPAHGTIAAAMVRLYEEDPTKSADPVVVCDLLKREGSLEDVGGPHRLIEIQGSTPATSSAPRYASIVHDHATLRRLIGSAGEIAELGYALPDDVHDAVMRAQNRLADVAASNGSRSYSSLDFGDVAALLAGSIPKIEADFLTRSDGQSLLYAGRMHLFHGEPTAGKSWLALSAALEVLKIGGAVLYLDYEDSLAGIVGRLMALGADPADVVDRFLYLKQDGPFGTAEKLELGGRLKVLNPDLVILDGVAEALSRDGLSEDRATEVVEWIEKLPRWLARTGAAVVMLDHVAKDKETRGRWARGSSAKLAAVDGAAYEVNVVTAFSRHKAGRVDLKVAKDRPGSFELGSIAATVKITPHADGERVVLELVPAESIKPSDPFRPTATMKRISDELERSKIPVSAKGLRLLIPGAKPKTVAEALARLQSEGWVTTYRNGSTELLKLDQPFREEAEPPGREPPPPPPPELPLEGGPIADAFPGTTVVEGPWKSQYERDKDLFDEHDPGPTDPGPDTEGDK